jgi:MFS superfamily sulfate permease-like transporter
MLKCIIFYQSIWMITFLAVLILNVDYGIYIGFACSLVLLLYKSQRPKTYILGEVDDSDIYVPINKHARAKEVKGIKIYQFCGPLNFANVQHFVNDLQNKCGIDIE